MTGINIKYYVKHLFLFIVVNWGCLLFAQKISPPFIMNTGLLDTTNKETLGLLSVPGSETITIYRPGESDTKYNLGCVIFPFKGYLYAQWQTSLKDEDAPDTHVLYCRSTDGKLWSKPEVLSEGSSSGMCTSGGWWTFKDTLVAYINVWPDNTDEPRGGFTEYMLSPDGINWSKRKPVLDNHGKPVKGIFEQDPHHLPDGRIISAFHLQPGLVVSPFYTDDKRGITGWTKSEFNNLPYEGNVSREIEPGWYFKRNSNVVMIFRDQKNSFYKLASESTDRGVTWSLPVITNIPDSRAKQSAGNLPDGTAYQVNCPSGSKTRFPLVILLSKDGYIFDKAYLIRSGGNDLQPKRYDGKYKREGYSYPKSVVWNGYLYVAYTTNKEDVELTRIPLSAISLN